MFQYQKKISDPITYIKRLYYQKHGLALPCKYLANCFLNSLCQNLVLVSSMSSEKPRFFLSQIEIGQVFKMFITFCIIWASHSYKLNSGKKKLNSWKKNLILVKQNVYTVFYKITNFECQPGCFRVFGHFQLQINLKCS